ncbi:MAG TPA: cupin domain-containing protein [Actinomycetota bacterium]|nr:cupin domain-containing protein [Actinomycetota bacterium]
MHHREERVFVREVTARSYPLREFRRAMLDAPRVRGPEVVTEGSLHRGDADVGHSGEAPTSRTWYRLSPGDEPFWTQTLQVHFVEIAPGGANRGHGHQNEAAFYVLEGRGYEIHDEERYEWERGDVAIVHSDCVHRHFNASDTERALLLVVKAKPLWMFLGLVQQGRQARMEEDSRWGPRVDWSDLWTPGVRGRRKVVKGADVPWTRARDGEIKVLSSAAVPDLRLFSLDIYERRVPPGSRTGRHWHMADEVVYILAGRGHSLQWEVEAEIDGRYHARIAREPSRHDVRAGDLLYVPPNTVHQTVNDSPQEPLLLLAAQNRVVKMLGYDNVVHLEDAPEWSGR